MSRAVPLAVLAALLLAPGCTREQPPASGVVLYHRYCAACHGEGGRGDGPAAAALSPPPTDLTHLTAGIAELMQQIDGSRTVRAHGSDTMPVWGEIFAQHLLAEPHAQRTALLAVQELAHHVSRLQESHR